MSGTIPAVDIVTVDRGDYSADQAKNWYYELPRARHSLSGESLRMIVLTVGPATDNQASTVRRSGMRERTAAQNLYNKRMQLLIASGLIAGITPTSIRNGSDQRILDIAIYRLDGGDAAEPTAGLSFLSGHK